MDKSYKIKIAIRELVEFVLRSGDLGGSGTGTSNTQLVQAIEAHVEIQKNSAPEYSPEVFLSYEIERDGILLKVSGRADGIIEMDDEVVIDEIKTTTLPLSEVTENKSPLHWAQAKCYAYIYGKKKELTSLKVQLTYCQLESREVKQFERDYSLTELKDFFYDVALKYLQWQRKVLDWREKRDRSIEKITFPFKTYRKGQRNLMVGSYYAITKQKKLLAQAPTGIGKTLAVLFPAIKAMGEGKTNKIFYLTAKTVARTVAEKALEKLRRKNLAFKSLTLTARDKICFNAPCNIEECEYAQGYYDRIHQGLAAIWEEPVFTQAIIEAYAEKFKICPFEFSLDIALWADCVICDYNYVFDPRVYLRRFFQDKPKDDYCLLIDEAHNLVDRARSMFSAELNKTKILAVKRIIKSSFPVVAQKLDKLNNYFLKLRKDCLQSNESYSTQPNPPEKIYPLIEDFLQITELVLAKNKANLLPESLIELFFEMIAFLRISEFYDKRYVTYIEVEQKEVKVKLFCLDPSYLLKQAVKRGKTAIFFSATLTPLEYFMNMFGGEEDDFKINLPSPFPQENFALLNVKNIDTTYRKRNLSYQKVARFIATIAISKKGNYLAFFPSYKYLQQVTEAFSQEFPKIDIISQEPEMTEEMREQFLTRFSPTNKESLVGFAVVGGIFGEGIDLEGDKLSGAIITGVSLPQICPEREIIRNYFQQQNGLGFEYAYVYPGMNKTIQAAGRVIRTSEDRGIVLLIGKRFNERSYQQLFPLHWSVCQSIQDVEDLAKKTDSFWP